MESDQRNRTTGFLLFTAHCQAIVDSSWTPRERRRYIDTVLWPACDKEMWRKKADDHNKNNAADIR